jgi:hypothetical protein
MTTPASPSALSPASPSAPAPHPIALPTDPKALERLRIMLPAILASLSIDALSTDYTKQFEEYTGAALAFKEPPTNDDEQDEILAAQRKVAKLRTNLLKQGDAAKAALNGPKDEIHAMVKAEEAKLKKVELHCQGLTNNYQMHLQRQREEAERQQAAAARKAQQEQAEIERQQADAERIRKEAKKAAQVDPNEAKRLAEEAQRLEDEAFAKSLEITPVAAPAAPLPEPKAQVVYDFTLNGRTEHEKGQNLLKLLAQHPEFFATHVKEGDGREYTIKLRISDVVDACNGNPPFAKLTSAHGITITERLKALR